jgi:hypothetical protein
VSWGGTPQGGDHPAYIMETSLFMHEVPEEMWLNTPDTVCVYLGRGTIAGFSRAFAARAGLSTLEEPLVESLSMSLYGRREVFEIERQTERVQLLPGEEFTDDPADLSEYGYWEWLVTPRMAGAQELYLRVSALFRDQWGVPTPVALPDQRVDVSISLPMGDAILQSLAGWLRRRA